MPKTKPEAKPSNPSEPKPVPPGFLKDAEGKPSSMRLMSIIALFASIFFGVMALQGSTDKYDVFIISAFLLAAFAPKAVQKFIENYYPRLP